MLNLTGVIRQRLIENPDHTALTAWNSQQKGFAKLTWGDLGLNIRAISAGLLAMGLKKGSRFVFLTEPTLEAIVFEMAVIAMGGHVIILHEDSPTELLKTVLKRTESTYAFAQDQERWERILDLMYHVPRLQRVITAAAVRGDSDTQVAFEELHDRGLQGLKRAGMYGFEAKEGDLLEHAAKGVEPSRDCLAFFSRDDQYPVTYSHALVIEKINLLKTNLGHVFSSGSKVATDASFSHTSTHMALLAQLAFGFELLVKPPSQDYSALFPQNNPQILWTEQPHLEHLRLNLIEKFREVKGIKKFLLDKSLQFLGSEEVMKSGVSGFLADKVVDSKVCEVLGRNLGKIFCASKGLAPQVLRFFKSMNAQVFESYSHPETIGFFTVTDGDPQHWGTLGKPLSGYQMRLTTDQEVIISGPNLPRGYGLCAAEVDVKTPENEMTFFSQEFKTGDLGTQDSEGNFILLGAHTARIILNENKMIFPEKIEAFFRQDPLFEKILVFGEGKPHLVALIQLNQKGFAEEFPECAPLLSDPLWHSNTEIRAKIKMRIHEINQDLVFFEMIQDFALMPTPWTVAQQELTLNRQINRKKIIEKNQMVIASLYEASLPSLN